jgi:hypothetical protein
MSVPHHHSGTANDMSSHLAGHTSKMFSAPHSTGFEYPPYNQEKAMTEALSSFPYEDSRDYSRGVDSDPYASTRSMYPSQYHGTNSAMPTYGRDTMSTADLFGSGNSSYYAPTSSNFHENHHNGATASRMMDCAKVKSSFPQPVYGGAAKTASAYGEYWE